MALRVRWLALMALAISSCSRVAFCLVERPLPFTEMAAAADDEEDEEAEEDPPLLELFCCCCCDCFLSSPLLVFFWFFFFFWREREFDEAADEDDAAPGSALAVFELVVEEEAAADEAAAEEEEEVRLRLEAEDREEERREVREVLSVSGSGVILLACGCRLHASTYSCTLGRSTQFFSPSSSNSCLKRATPPLEGRCNRVSISRLRLSSSRSFRPRI
mmetsp:Transcript_3956/g.9696  ORF Transcript_3956/g.9696 Transcript_3956/m.9696 type:complete len:218 (-) Transcript_3956:1638-2291(-)